jgi:hypothetical protein
MAGVSGNKFNYKLFYYLHVSDAYILYQVATDIKYCRKSFNPAAGVTRDTEIEVEFSADMVRRCDHFKISADLENFRSFWHQKHEFRPQKYHDLS